MFDFKNCILKITSKSRSLHVVRLQIFGLFYVFLCCSMYCLFCVVLCIFCVYMCTVRIPPGGYPIAVKYIISYHIKIKTNRKGRTVRIRKFLLYFSKLHCTSRQPNSVVDLAWSVNHIKPVMWSCLKNCVFTFLFFFGGGVRGYCGLQPGILSSLACTNGSQRVTK